MSHWQYIYSRFSRILAATVWASLIRSLSSSLSRWAAVCAALTAEFCTAVPWGVSAALTAAVCAPIWEAVLRSKPSRYVFSSFQQQSVQQVCVAVPAAVPATSWQQFHQHLCSICASVPATSWQQFQQHLCSIYAAVPAAVWPTVWLSVFGSSLSSPCM